MIKNIFKEIITVIMLSVLATFLFICMLVILVHSHEVNSPIRAREGDVIIALDTEYKL